MKVRCITNKFSEIPRYVYSDLHSYSSETVLPIDIGQESIVYAITTIKGYAWFMVDVDGIPDPMFYPADIFKVIDGRLSRYWIMGEGTDVYNNELKSHTIGFKELVENEYLYGEYLEEYPDSVQIFTRCIELMRNEFNT